MVTSNVASVKLVRRVIIRFIVLSARPKLTDWKSVVLINTKKDMNPHQ